MLDEYIELGGHFKYSLQGVRPQSCSSDPCDNWNPTLSVSRPHLQAAVSPCAPVSLGSVLRTCVEGEETTHSFVWSTYWLQAGPQLRQIILDAQ